MQTPVLNFELFRYQNSKMSLADDLVVVEEPLQIILQYGPEAARQEHTLTLTMRTPGHDFELAIGFLLSEGVIDSPAQILKVWHCEQPKDPAEGENVLKVALTPELSFEIGDLQRNFYSSASCGVCGKTAIDKVIACAGVLAFGAAALQIEILTHLEHAFSERQSLFRHTGGIHAAALFSTSGKLLILREDIGRHNALDKLIGALSAMPEIDRSRTILFLSGRVGYELVQKSIMAQLPVIAALGAPSSLAVSLARRHQQTLVGFLKRERFNVYSGAERFVSSLEGC
ncbi:MAG: formate dehydrogenase accessory sulfurtransferase FdhD [Bacteroidota bacterium]